MGIKQTDLLFTVFSSFYHNQPQNKKSGKSEYEIKKYILELLGKHNILITDQYNIIENNKIGFFFIQEVYSLEVFYFFMENLKKSDLICDYYYNFDIGMKIN